MSYRHQLPQLSSAPFLTDGGLETTLIFHQGLDLPYFAAFPLMANADGRARLGQYYDPYFAVAAADGVGIILDTPTWRASPDWGDRLGWSAADLAAASRDAADLVADYRTRAGAPTVVVNGQMGPRGDGYVPGALMTAEESRAYHSPQIAAFTASVADMVTVYTMNYAAEATGVALAAADHDMPAAVSFTVETDGRLPDGTSLREAIERVDDATHGSAAYFMINCAHPTHFADVLEPGTAWMGRIHGIRANSSRKSHAELDEATELDDGNPEEFGGQLADLHRLLPHVNVLGGCCGTDDRHVAAISRHLRSH